MPDTVVLNCSSGCWSTAAIATAVAASSNSVEWEDLAHDAASLAKFLPMLQHQLVCMAAIIAATALLPLQLHGCPAKNVTESGNRISMHTRVCGIFTAIAVTVFVTAAAVARCKEKRW